MAIIVKLAQPPLHIDPVAVAKHLNLCCFQSPATVDPSKGDSMKNVLKLAAIGGALAFALSGCATITEGKTDALAVNTTPDGAKCTLKNGVGEWYITTPGSAEVHKSKTDLDISCKKEGFQDGHIVMESHFEGMTVGNVILGGVIGIGVDAASGAMNHYDKSVSLTLVPNVPVSSVAPVTDGKPTS